jgi:hypothetical protein
MMPEPPGPFNEEEEDEEEDEFEEEEALLILKCRLMVQRKPLSCDGRCVKKNEGTLEMDVCNHFLIVDATEEEEAEYDSIEEN